MQDIIEGNDAPLWRLISIAVQASAMLMLVSLMLNSTNQDESF